MFQRAITIEPLSVVDRGGSVGPKRQGEMSLARVLLADIDSGLEQVFNGINVTAADECGEVQMHDNGVRRRALVDDIKDTVGDASFLLLQGADRCVDGIDYAGSGRQPETFELCACICGEGGDLKAALGKEVGGEDTCAAAVPEQHDLFCRAGGTRCQLLQCQQGAHELVYGVDQRTRRLGSERLPGRHIFRERACM